MSTQRGNLIVSTRIDTRPRKTALIVLNLIEFIFGLFIMCSDFFKEAFYWTFDTTSFTVLYIFGAVLIGLSIFNIASGLINLKSCCDVYENAVVGTTGMSLTTPAQNFELTYDQILNVAESGKEGIQIFTSYGAFSVLAFANRPDVIEEICARMNAKH